MAKNEDKYTHPKLREEIKDEIQAGDKGGKKGQWSARKSQLLTREYEKRGGGYKGEKDKSQKDLEKWTEEEWQTQDGRADARDGDETARYLPKKAWDQLSDEERQETENKKRQGSKKGEQYVSNTPQAKEARGAAKDLPLKGYDDLGVDEVKKKIQGLSKDEVQSILLYEKKHKNRKTLVKALDRKA